MSDEKNSPDSYQAFMKTLDVFNEAMDKYRDKPVVSSLMSLIDEQAAGRKFGAAVYGDNPDQPFDYYTVRLHNKRLELVSRGKDEPDIDWKVSMEYLQSVHDDPQAYIDNPLKLDFDWLKNRLGDAA